jgi:adenine-specific DNA-methyltransferase
MPQLTWLGDTDARRASRRVPYRILQPIQTVGDPTADNLLIQGDNLEALKALLPFYAGRVKCIFIDPPYNTKSAFEHYDDNLEHSQWLSMMYPRLQLLRELLSEDGSIWVTIDDTEGHYLKALMDEVFGRANFIANVVWQKAYTSNQTAAHISNTHDHLIVFARSASDFRIGKLPRSSAQKAKFRNPDEDPRGPWKAENLSAGKFYAAGQFTIVGPTGKEFRPPKGRYWRCNEPQYKTWLADGRITFGLRGTGRPMLKKYLSEMSDGLTTNTWWRHEDFGSNKEASIDLKKLFPDVVVFQNPKPEKLLASVIELSTMRDDLVLDSFLGSGTTAAVAHKMGRRWIGVEMGEHARTHCLPRLQKVIEGEQGGISESVGWRGGGGFRFMKLGAKAFFDDGALNADIRFKDLAAFLWFLETRTPHPTGKFKSPLLGVHDGTAYVLLYNGIIADRRPESGNVLTTAVWNHIRSLLPRDRRGTVIYGEASRFSDARLKNLGLIFKQIPYDVGIR